MLEAMWRASLSPASVGVRYHSSADKSVHISFTELDSQARADAAAIRAAGWRAGDRALLIFESGLEFVRAIYAAFYAGLTIVPVPVTVSRDPEVTRARIAAIAADCGSRFALTTPTASAMVGGNYDDMTLLNLGDLDPVVGTEWVAPATSATDIAVIQYTSGSTGTPKGVIISHGNLVANQRAIAEVARLDQNTVLVGWLPHYHDMGLGMFIQAIYGRFNLVFTSPSQFLRRPILWLRLLSRYRATVTVAPNFAYDLCARLVKDQEVSELDLSSIQTMITGSEPVRYKTLVMFGLRFSSSGLSPMVFMPAFGMAETTLLVTGKPAGSDVRVLRVDADKLEHGRASPAGDGRVIELVSCGRPASAHHVIIVDPSTGQLLPDDLVGEIWVRGPSVAQGYWGRAEDTRESFDARLANGTKSFLRTGDLGFLTDGELVVTGRLKDLIIINGRNISPADLELECAQLLGTTSGCLQAAFELVEQGVAVVAEVDPGNIESALAQVSSVCDRLASVHSLHPFSLVLVRRGAIPRTSSGKVQRKIARDLLISGGFAILKSSGFVSATVTQEMVST